MSREGVLMIRYGVRVGDDGRWYLRTDRWSEAHEYAVALSETGLGCAQVRDFVDGRQDSYRNGDVVRERIQVEGGRA